MANILSTTNSALAAAQAGLATTAHNIANAKTPGYNRQVVLQSAVGGQDEGGGFIGKGTQVVSVRRVYNEYLGAQIRTGQTNKAQLESHYNQISRINNMLADPTSGLSPVLQDFFKSVQNLAANPEARGSVLASAQSLASRFQSLDGQLRELRVAVNTEINSSITAINSYSRQIADLNQAIANAQSGSGQLPNDLMDKRDYLVEELSKYTKVTVTKDGNSYGIFIGNGQPMVVGSNVSQLVATTSPTDISEVTVGLMTGGQTIRLAENSLQGGKLGGLFEFRSTSLTNAQNDLGRIALGLATTFNEQHRLGKDTTGAMGGDFFRMEPPAVQFADTVTARINPVVTDVGELKASDYQLAYDGSNYTLTRLRDNVQVGTAPGPGFPASGIAADGLNITMASGAMAAGDYFVIKPTAYAASAFNVLVADPNKIAAAAPIRTSSPMSNSGTGLISAGTVDTNFTTAMATPPTTFTYVANVPATVPPSGTLNSTAAFPGTGFPFEVKVTHDGSSTIYAPNTPIPYTPGATITFGASLPGPPPDVGGISFELSGQPGNGDTFTVDNNLNTEGDNRNIVLLGKLQTTDTLDGGLTYQGALAQLVGSVGDKTHELEVGSEAQGNLVGQLRQAQEADSGVNLDEEGANLLRYQQAYVAAGKVMQAVKEMFDMLVSLGQ